jgi:8-amino-7-oxononanoate synthase
MMQKRLARYETILNQLERKGRRRKLSARSGKDFTSNDYLGLAESQRLRASVMSALDRGVPVGAGGSRLLRGNHSEHEMLEEEAATFFRSQRMLYFGSGYAANLAVLATLPQRNDLIIYDELIHASAHAGIAAGRSAAASVPHNDLDATEDAIRKWRHADGNGHPWIVVESLYSMDGDNAPLVGLMELADRYDGFLFVDEAHATGVHGVDGRGFATELEGRENVIVLHTCGKALGGEGALVGGSGVLCDYLINHARPFIYATAPSPLAAAVVREALKILSDEPERRRKLHRMIAYANELILSQLGCKGSGSQILPVILGDNARTLRIAQQMQADGFDIRAIRPPTVPANTSRLRISVTLNVEPLTVSQMFDRLATVIAEAQQ